MGSIKYGTPVDRERPLYPFESGFMPIPGLKEGDARGITRVHAARDVALVVG